MISAMPAVAVRRGRKKSHTFPRLNLSKGAHHTNSNSSINHHSFTHRQSISTIHAGNVRAFHHRRRYDTELDRQRRRFLIYMGTLFLITGLLLVFIGVGAAVPTSQTVGLILISIGAVFCIIKVFCSEAHATEVPRKVIVRDVDAESNSGANNNEEEDAASPLANISEFTELQGADTAAQDGGSHQNSVASPTSPPNSIPETQVLITHDSGGRY